MSKVAMSDFDSKKYKEMIKEMNPEQPKESLFIWLANKENTMNKEQEDWEKSYQRLLLEHCTLDSLYDSLQQENASLSNQNTLLVEDNLAMSKALSELITKMKAEHEETA